jgi:hypothetical protein
MRRMSKVPRLPSDRTAERESSSSAVASSSGNGSGNVSSGNNNGNDNGNRSGSGSGNYSPKVRHAISSTSGSSSNNNGANDNHGAASSAAAASQYLINSHAAEAIIERYQQQRMGMSDTASGMYQMTDEQADESYQRILRKKKSAKVRKWRKKIKQSKLTEDDKIEKAREQKKLLIKEKHDLTERLCQLNESIAAIQQRRADSLRVQVCF